MDDGGIGVQILDETKRVVPLVTWPQSTRGCLRTRDSGDQLTVVSALGREAQYIPNSHCRDDNRNRMPVKRVLHAMRHFVHRLSGLPAGWTE
jgi:hypothetical protein